MSVEITDSDYRLDDQVGYLLRLASQRHAVIFQKHSIDGLTPTQFATLIRIDEVGPVSQNQLGRLAAMDVATIKGVVDRLKAKSLVRSAPDKADKRRSIITLTDTGARLIGELKQVGEVISDETLAPLTAAERRALVGLLAKLG